MGGISSPDTLAALALVPEQLPGYVRSVAGSELRFVRGFPVYLAGGGAVLIGQPTADDPSLSEIVAAGYEARNNPELDAAIAELAAWPGVTSLTVLAPARPQAAPVSASQGAVTHKRAGQRENSQAASGQERGGQAAESPHSPEQPRSGESGASGSKNTGDYSESHDIYLALPLPFAAPSDNFSGVANQKLRNMLRRADRELVIGREEWGPECQALAKSYTASRVLEAGTRYIFENLSAYAALPGVRVFTARSKEGGNLHGLCIADFTPLATAFYMFAFRRKEAVPGTADRLLFAVVEEAQKQGHERVNLGLAINSGIGFFKQKWGAKNFLPQVECSWQPRREKKGFFKSLFG